MPFSKRQLRSITQSRGQAFIGRDRGPYSMRVAETYIRRKLYSLEDKTIAQEYRLFEEASKDIRDYALRATTAKLVDTAWKKAALEYAERRVLGLMLSVEQNAQAAARLAYYAGYVGRLWVLDSMTTDEAPLNKAVMQVKNPPDRDELRLHYDTALMWGLIKLRGRATRALVEEMPLAQAAKHLADFGAHRSEPVGLFYQSQIATRTAVMRASNYGAYDAFMAQAQPQTEAEGSDRDWVLGMMWLSQRDSRVCPTCSGLDGQVWLLSEMWGLLLTGLPPDGSHYGCRCTVIPILLPNLLKPENAPPEQTFDEWLQANGYDMLVNDFADETELASTQI